MTSPLDSEAFPDLSRASLREDGCPPDSPDIEGYQVLEELPRGGQAIVYKALHKPTGAKVALKVLPVGLLASSSARRSFEREVELASGLRHPNIVAIRESGIARGQYYFAMEYIRGPTLDKYVGSRSLSLREKMVLLCKVCDGMTEAHQHGVIHRDLKPSNILVDEEGEPHIVDFGLAKVVKGLEEVPAKTLLPTLTGEIKGTLAYMSPEQAAGRPEKVDVRTDVYALGVILYQMITGQFPYDVSGTALETMNAIKSADPIRPRTLVRRLDSDVEAILLKCLAKEPLQRYQSAAQLWHDIRCWLDGLPIVAKSVSSIYLLRKIVSRHRYTAATIGLLFLIVLGFTCFSLSLYADARRAQRESSDLAARWEAADDRTLMVAQGAAFTCFLRAYLAGEIEEANGVSTYLSGGSRESKAAAFLLDPSPLAKKEMDFRDSLGAEDRWFADFIIGEYHLSNGQRDKALEAYRQGEREIAGAADRRTKTAGWSAELLKARIQKLSPLDKSGGLSHEN